MELILSETRDIMNSYSLSDLDPSIIVEPNRPAKHAVIWLHGLGADGNDFVGLLPQLNLPDDHAIRFVFPHAPRQAVTVNGGMVMRSWYDIYSMEIASKIDEHSIEQSSGVLVELIQQQIEQGISAENIIIAGFSQGGLITLHTVLHSGITLGGAIALSTYYPDVCLKQSSCADEEIPVMMVHGDYDPVIPVGIAEASYQKLLEIGCQVSWQRYPMEHQVCMSEIEQISYFIQHALAD